MGTIEDVEALLRELHFARDVHAHLNQVRLTHESDAQTFARILRLARERVCKPCGGYGRTMFNDLCNACNGTGEMAVVVTSGAPKKVNVYTLYVNGKFGHNEGPSCAAFQLFSVETNQPQPTAKEIRVATEERLRREDVESGAKYEVTLREETRSVDPDGKAATCTYLLFGDKKVLAGTV